jgi:hypothetical protein
MPSLEWHRMRRLSEKVIDEFHNTVADDYLLRRKLHPNTDIYSGQMAFPVEGNADRPGTKDRLSRQAYVGAGSPDYVP